MPKKSISHTEARFLEFRARLKSETGDKAALVHGSSAVHVLANEFTPLRKFRSVQDAIDNFARYFPAEFVNKS